MADQQIARKNFRLHLIEGALYGSTGVLLSSQTLYPALVMRLGGSNTQIGLLPIVVFFSFSLPQIFSANIITRHQYRLPWTLAGGFLQRLQILFIACSVLFLGRSHPAAALTLFLIVFAVNQALAGITSPAWFDLVAKTVPAVERGRLMGWRQSIAGMGGLVNGLFISVAFSLLVFPFSYGAIFGWALVLQMASLAVQRGVREIEPSEPQPSASVRGLFERVRTSLLENPTLRTFLLSSALTTVGLTATAFYTAYALRQFRAPESAVGVFAMLSVGAQIGGSALIGIISDRFGTHRALQVCAASTVAALVCALVATSTLWFYPVFVFSGMTLGAESMTRYNFAAEISEQKTRALTIGLLNAWIAPFYCTSLVAGWMSSWLNFHSLCLVSLVFALAGLGVLLRIHNPRVELADSRNK